MEKKQAVKIRFPSFWSDDPRLPVKRLQPTPSFPASLFRFERQKRGRGMGEVVVRGSVAWARGGVKGRDVSWEWSGGGAGQPGGGWAGEAKEVFLGRQRHVGRHCERGRRRQRAWGFSLRSSACPIPLPSPPLWSCRPKNTPISARPAAPCLSRLLPPPAHPHDPLTPPRAHAPQPLTM